MRVKEFVARVEEEASVPHMEETFSTQNGLLTHFQKSPLVMQWQYAITTSKRLIALPPRNGPSAKKKKVVIWQYIQKKNMNASVYYHQVQRCKRWNSNLNLIHHKGTYTPSTLACYFLSLNHFVLCKKTKDV